MKPFHSGARPRRFRTPDFKDAVPDSILLDDRTVVVNPEWETAEYEEAFFDAKKRLLKAKTLYEAVREMRNQKR